MFGLGKLFGERRRAKSAQEALYEVITRQSLHPWFYEEVGINPNFTGKFDVSALHAHLFIARLADQPQTPSWFVQDFFDFLFSRWDFALRESGVGDMSVGKHMKRLVQGFLGRASAYGQALTSDDETALSETLAANLDLSHASPQQLRQLQLYVVKINQFLLAQSTENMLEGHCELPTPEKLLAA